MNKKNWMVVIVLLAALGGGAYWLFFAAAPPPPQTPAAPPPQAITYAGNTIVEEDDGRVVWRIHAAAINIDPATENTLLTDIKGTFYQADGKSVAVTAPEGSFSRASRDVELRGAVHAVSSAGETFTSATARWSKERFYGEGGVKVTKDDIVVTGDRLESDGGLQKIKVTGNARIEKGGAQ